MSTSAFPVRGILTAAGSFIESAVVLAKNRIELISVELQEEKYRLIQLVVWLAAAVFAAVMALTFASIMVVYYLWAKDPLIALGMLTGFYGVALGVVVWRLRESITGQPKPFAATIAEFEKDRACIRPES
jgi:uncharacterized membrane protein YqjE